MAISSRALEQPDAALLHCRLSLQLKLVRDVAIPLGAFSNIVCTMHAPLLPRCSSGAASKRLVRTSPPVLLPRHGEVALPWPGCTRDFAVRGIDELLPALAEEPLAVELWHHDKYTQKVLLGVATVDVAEVLSVMLQVGWFKYTKRKYGEGRRILKMAPLHHHFEKSGWTETQVVIRFWIITMLLCLVGLATLKLR